MKEILGKYALLSDRELELEVKKIVDANKGMPINGRIGKAMQQLRGKASGQKIVELIKKNS